MNKVAPHNFSKFANRKRNISNGHNPDSEPRRIGRKRIQTDREVHTTHKQYTSEEEEENEQESQRSKLNRRNKNRNKSSSSSNEDDDDDDDSENDSQSNRSRLRRQQQKKQQEELKYKSKLVENAKKKLGQQEQEIESLNTKLDKQQKNLKMLNQQNESLIAKTNQLDTVMQEKTIVQSHFAAQMVKVDKAKNVIQRRGTNIYDKAELFQMAVLQKPKGKQVGSRIVDFFSYVNLLLENNYFLSKKVYFISNSTGQKCEVFFSSNAFLINAYIFSLILFIPFFIKFFLDSQLDSIEDIFLHKYSISVGMYFIYTLTIFLLIQILIAYKRFDDAKKKEVREVAKSGLQINNFQIIFGEWNWRIKDEYSKQKSLFALMKYAQSVFRYEDKNNETEYKFRETKIFIMDIISYLLIIGSMILTAYIRYERYLLDLTSILFISEIVHGLVICLIGKVTCEISMLLIKQINGFNSNENNLNKYNKSFLSQSLPAAVSILMAYNTFLSADQLTIDFSFFSTKVPFNSSTFSCSEQQTSHFLFGLAIGYFVINTIWQYLPSVKNLFLQRSSGKSQFKKLIEFDMMEASIPLVVLNMIILTLLPFSGFTVVLALILFGLNFLNEWVIIKKCRLPQYKGVSKSLLKVYFSYYYNMSIMFSFCCYALYYTNTFLVNTQSTPNFSTIREVSIIRIVYDIITWYPLVYISMLMYLASHVTSSGLIVNWKQEITHKSKEINGVKQYYEQKIKRLEAKMKQTQNVLQNIENLEEQDVTINLGQEKQPIQKQEKRKSQDSIHKKSTQFTLSTDQDFGQRSSLKLMNHSNPSFNNHQQSQVSIKNYIKTLKDIQEEDSQFKIQSP